MKIIKYILVFLILFVTSIFAIYNSNPVHLDYIIGSNDIPLALLLVLTMIFGSLLGFAFSIFKSLKVKRENFILKQNIKLAHKEISNLRELPLRDAH